MIPSQGVLASRVLLAEQGGSGANPGTKPGVLYEAGEVVRPDSDLSTLVANHSGRIATVRCHPRLVLSGQCSECFHPNELQKKLMPNNWVADR
jgi:hypothetical protein